MVRMIPAQVAPDAPPGERAVFRALAEAPDTEEWIALHSLRLAKHPRQQRGETDFLVIAPGLGLAVIEVKSHKSVARDDAGRWLLGRAAPTHRSPFAQADDAKFAISEYLSGQIGMTSTHVESCVWFTHVPARRELPNSIEWAPWQVLDSSDLSNDPVAAIRHVIESGRAHRAAAGHDWPSIIGPDVPTALRIVELLRPQVAAAPSPADARAARRVELERLLDEQWSVVDGLAGNERLLVTGPAGCGKTFMALQIARNLSDQGKRGLLLCFNHGLSVQLTDQAADIEGLTVTTLAGHMLELSGLEPRSDTDRDFWERDLPAAAWEAAAERDGLGFDYLIADEAQDLCQRGYLEVLDVSLARGLRRGRWVFFGDFDEQRIYGGVPITEALAELGPHARYNLRVNCRNTPGIARWLAEFGGRDGVYASCRRTADGSAPAVHTYVDDDEQLRLLVAEVRRARDEGFGLAEIVVLSRYRSGAAAQCTDPWLAPLLVDARRGGPVAKGRVRYSTIHSFKGLEAPAVILTDVTPSGRGPYTDLFNVGVTRAQDWLSVLATSDGLAQLREGVRQE